MYSPLNFKIDASIDSCMKNMRSFLNQMKRLYGPRDLDEAKPFIDHLKKRIDENINQFVAVNFPERVQACGCTIKNNMKYEIDEIVLVPSDDELTPPPVQVEQLAGIVHSKTPNASTENEMEANSSGLQEPFRRQLAGVKQQSMNQKDQRKQLKIQTKYKCDACNYTSHKRYRIKYHMVVHSGVRNFVCDKCDQAFTHKHNLMRHQRRKVKCTSSLDFHGFEPSE